MILSLKYLFAAHIFLVLIVLLLAFDLGRNKKSGIKITNKEITWFSGKFTGKNIYQIFSMLNSKKDWIYLTN